MDARRMLSAAVLTAAIAGSALCQTVSPGPSPVKPSPTPDAAAIKAAASEKRAKTLKFGTDAEISAVLKQLLDDKDDAHNQEVLRALAATRNSPLKTSILSFFRLREWKGAEAEAARIVRDRVTEDDATITAALEYGATVKSALVLAEANEILEDGFDVPFARSLLMVAGRAGGSAEERLLRGIYEDVEANATVREGVLLALAEMRISGETRTFLEGIAGNRDERKILRMYAIGALGKSAEGSAGAASLPLLKILTQDKDPNVRAQAVKAIADSGTGSDAEREIGDALRDSNDGVRVAAVQAAGVLGIASLADNLAYRAQFDGSTRIREESIRSLAGLGEPGWKKIEILLAPKDFPEGLRLIAFASIAEKDAESLYHLLRKAMDSATALGMTEGYRRVSAIIGDKGGKGFEPEARSFVQSQDFLVRLHGIAWIKRNKAASLRGELERLGEKDPDQQVKRKAKEALEAF